MGNTQGANAPDAPKARASSVITAAPTPLPASDSTATIDDLVDDVMWEIFGYLSYTEVIVASRTCKRWRELSLENRNKTWRIRRTIKDAEVVELSLTHPVIRSLDLRYCREVTVEGLRALAPCCVGMFTLDLAECLYLTDADLEVFQKEHLHRVEIVSLRMCLGITNATVARIISVAPRIHTLDLSFTKLQFDVLSVIAKLGPSLRSLTIKSSSTNFVLYGDGWERHFKVLAEACPNIQVLRIPGAYLHMSIEAGMIFADNFPALRTLDICGGRYGEMELHPGLEAFLTRLVPRLTWLQCDTIMLGNTTAPDLSPTSIIPHCVNLQHLSLPDYNDTDGKFTLALHIGTIPNLQSLTIGVGDLRSLLRNCQTLKQLTIRRRGPGDGDAATLEKYHNVKVNFLNLDAHMRPR